jgi:hypothetical protein
MLLNLTVSLCYIYLPGLQLDSSNKYYGYFGCVFGIIL